MSRLENQYIHDDSGLTRVVLQRGFEAVFSSHHYEMVKKRRWWVKWNERGKIQSVITKIVTNGRRTDTTLPNFILAGGDVEGGVRYDCVHRNGDKLDCTDKNIKGTATSRRLLNSDAIQPKPAAAKTVRVEVKKKKSERKRRVLPTSKTADNHIYLTTKGMFKVRFVFPRGQGEKFVREFATREDAIACRDEFQAMRSRQVRDSLAETRDARYASQG